MKFDTLKPNHLHAYVDLNKNLYLTLSFGTSLRYHTHEV